MPELRVRVCARLARDVTAALRARGLAGVQIAPFHAACLPRHGAGARLDFGPGDLVVGGPCAREAAPDAPPTSVLAPATCFELVAAPEQVEALQREGAFLVTPGWLAAWRSWMADAGLTPEIARGLFGESARRVVLLDTGVDPDGRAELAAFSAFVGLPADVVEVGTERLGLVVAEAIYRWRTHRAEERLADHSMVLDTLASLRPGSSEAEVAGAVLDLARVLCGATRATYWPVEGGALGPPCAQPEGEVDARLAQAVRDMAGADALLEGGDGFAVRLGPPEREVGRLAVTGIAFPQYLGRYRELGGALAQAGYLAIQDARHVSELERSRDELRRHRDMLEEVVARRTESLARSVEELRAASERIQTLRGLVPICFGCKKIRDDAGFWQRLEEYLAAHSEATFSHGLCPECLDRLYPDT